MININCSLQTIFIKRQVPVREIAYLYSIGVTALEEGSTDLEGLGMELVLTDLSLNC
jgi:hypothetical protein